MDIHRHCYHMPDYSSTHYNKDWSQHEDNSAHRCCNIRPPQPIKTQPDYKYAFLTNHTLLEQLCYYLKITKHDVDLTTLQTNILAKLQQTKTHVLLTKA